jgi:rare lipoprotein A
MPRRLAASVLFVAFCTLLAGCASSKSENLASYYADKYQGRKTANGEIFDTRKLTAAHKTLPFGTRVRVTNLGNGKSVVVRVNDRGPFVAGRVIDLSPAAARKLDMIRAGVTRVKLEVLGTEAVAGVRD